MNNGEFSTGQIEHERLELEKKLLDGNYSILIIKPSGEELVAECPALVEKYKLGEVIRSVLDDQGLGVVINGTIELEESQIRKIYPILEKPSEFGDGWKSDVIEHMTEQPLEYYVIEGEDALNKTQDLKKSVRDKWVDASSPQSFVVNNLIHVADKEDLIATYETLVLNKK